MGELASSRSAAFSHGPGHKSVRGHAERETMREGSPEGKRGISVAYPFLSPGLPESRYFGGFPVPYNKCTSFTYLPSIFFPHLSGFLLMVTDSHD